MATIVDRDILREIKTFPSLVKYLRDDLGWPIESDDFEEILFDYTAEELGIDAKTAARVQGIKQLRPLTTNQPWGIFFIKFEPKRLPVLALRRILGRLVVRKRASANNADRAAWDKHDLLFISNYGEGDDRQITFAHFTDSGDHADLPTLKVLGWDQEDTALHLDHVQKELHDHLRWPSNTKDLSQWRAQWSGAFELKHREVITTSKQLALRLADLARDIRKRCNAAMKIETERGPLRTLMKGFQQALIHDLTEDDFADMYAQTISYGLLSARVSRPAGMTANNLSDMVPPQTNPFLKELLETFLNVGGRKWSTETGRLTGIDFDELGINDVVDTLRAANMEAVLRDFGNRNPTEDPVIHFYELFLKEYDAKKRMQRGVFYTPRPVVSYIVRSVHELLRSELGLADGLADTSTWAAMLMKHDGLKLPEIEVVDPKTRETSRQPINPGEHFVQILDPACGTGTFLVECIDVIYNHLRDRWTKEGHGELWVDQKWNEYVPRHLLPRLYGYELMMAPYAIAHMKIGLKLYETGYKFGSGERARIYLTNALEPPQDFSDTFEQMAPALAHEARAVNQVKRSKQFGVVITNPPYAQMSANLTDAAVALVEPYRYLRGERIIEKSALSLERNLNDDYVKFIRLAEQQIESHGGVLGYITNNAYVDALTLRGMRTHLLDNLQDLKLLNLHGDSDKRDVSADGTADENVFEIKKGVAILLGAGRADRDDSRRNDSRVVIAELRGTSVSKTSWLAEHSAKTTQWTEFAPRATAYLFVQHDTSAVAEYDSGISIAELMPEFATGFTSGFDEVLTGFTADELADDLDQFSTRSKSELEAQLNLDGVFAKKVFARRRSIASDQKLRTRIKPFLFTPFDVRYTYYRRDMLMTASHRVGRHLLDGENVALMLMRQVSFGGAFSHAFVTRYLPNNRAFYSTKGKVAYFPLVLLPESEGLGPAGSRPPTPNLNPTRWEQLGLALCKGSRRPDAMTVLGYVYATLNSRTFRSRYDRLLRSEYPRIPLPRDPALGSELAQVGRRLARVHLFDSEELKSLSLGAYRGGTGPEVVAPHYAQGTIWLDKKRTFGFVAVPEAVWEFEIGGYQVCEKWLKDRKGGG